MFTVYNFEKETAITILRLKPDNLAIFSFLCYDIYGGVFAENEFEVLTYERLRHFEIFLNKITYRNFQTHGAFEFLLVLEGRGSIQFRDGEKALQPGSLILVDPYEAHEIDARGGYVLALIFQVSRHFCQEYIPLLRSVRFDHCDLSQALPAEALAACRTHILEAALAFLQEEAHFSLKCVTHTAELFHLLLEQLPYTVLTEQDHASLKKKIQRMGRIAAYLEENYLQPIRLGDLAQQEHLTSTYVSHLFTEQYGVSFQTYLNNLRFEKAMSYLHSSMSLSDIAMSSGFSDPKYLNRMFQKRMGCTLKEYRKGFRKNAEVHSETPPTILLEQIYTAQESLSYLQTHSVG